MYIGKKMLDFSQTCEKKQWPVHGKGNDQKKLIGSKYTCMSRSS